jgi:hypothetical protein
MSAIVKTGLAVMSLWVASIPVSAQVSTPLEVELVLSVDWEGDKLRTRDLDAMRAFRTRFPEVKLTHYLNAAYYTKSWSTVPDAITKLIKSVHSSKDALGLHIHSWENLVRKSGVTFREGPRYLGDALPERFHGERGSDVPISAYSKSELIKIIRYSLNKLSEHGFTNITSFRGGGWQSSTKLQAALRTFGIHIDSSAVNPKIIDGRYPGTDLESRVLSLWGEVDLETKSHIRENMMIAPNNFGLADYIDFKSFKQMANHLFESARKNGDGKVTIHYGFHQETARLYMDRVAGALIWLKHLEKLGIIQIRYSTVDDSTKALSSRFIKSVIDGNRCNILFKLP